MKNDVEILGTRKLVKWLVITTIMIIVLNIINELLGRPSWNIDRFINVEHEANFPTWFSSILLAIAAFVAYHCSLAAKTRQAGQRLWQVMSLGLIAMSCDETAMIHEHVGAAINKYFLNKAKFPWYVVLGPLVIFAVVFFAFKLKKYLRGSTKAMRFLAIGAGIYFFGAIVLEATAKFLHSHNLGLLLKAEDLIEESFEMFGVVIIIKGLIEHYNWLNNNSN